MRPLSSLVGQPIRSLQTMLRVIAEDDPTHLRIVPDGIYGPETTAAVSTFRSHIDDIIRRLNDIQIMLNDDDTVTALHQALQNL